MTANLIKSKKIGLKGLTKLVLSVKGMWWVQPFIRQLHVDLFCRAHKLYLILSINVFIPICPFFAFSAMSERDGLNLLLSVTVIND